VNDRKLRLHLDSTGDRRFDAILGGGFPAQSVIVLAGEPGSGKTVLTLQLLFKAAREGKNCVYLTTLSEPAIKLIRYMQFFDFFDPDVLDARIRFHDIGAAVREGPDATMAALSNIVQREEPNVIAIDSFKAIADLMPDAGVARKFVYDLATHTATWGATTLLLGEYGADDLSRRPEFAVADGIVQLGSHRRELTSLRELEIVKLRGSGYVGGRHFFEIDSRGFFVYPRVRAPQGTSRGRTAHPDARLSTGVAGLDALFGGGVPALSNTVIQGPTGSGKTLLGLQFLIEGARIGERGALCTLEETPDQLRAIAANMGWNLEALERKGLLVINYCSPVELSTDRYLQDMRDLVAATGIRRVVFDSLTSMALGVPSERRFKELVYAMGKHMREESVTLLMTVETPQAIGSNEVTARGVSFIADNLIQLRFFDAGAELKRAISVLKARGIKHETATRLLHIESKGLRLSRPVRGRARGASTAAERRRSPRRGPR
jgi:circadian clock protein KaiC